MVLRNDTLSCDTTRLAHWQNNPLYDYNRELQVPEWDLYRWLNMQLMKLLEKIFGSRFAEEHTDTVLIILFVVLILLLIWFLVKKRPELFMRAGKNKTTIPYIISEDTIYGVDFQAEITAALAQGDHKEAIRLLYLQTLKSLSERKVIDWQIYKTPTQYIYEMKPESSRENFRRLTNCFLRVRYGNFEATLQLFDQMKQLQQEIGKGGEV